MKKIFLYSTILFQVLLIISLIQGIQLALRAKSRVTDLEKRKTMLVEQQKKLEDQLQYVESDYYVEKVAREELQMARPGETVVLLPDIPQATGNPTSTESHSTALPNWQKWWHVLSGKM